MVTVGYVMNASLNSTIRLPVKNGELPSMNWIKCYAVPIANTAMWKSLIEEEKGANNSDVLHLMQQQIASTYQQVNQIAHLGALGLTDKGIRKR